MQGNGRERNRKGPPITSPPSTQAKSCAARCKEQDRGWLCCQKNLARLSCLSRLPLLLSSPAHTHPFLPMSGWHGRRGPPLCSGTMNLAANLAEDAGRCGSGLDRSPSEVCAQLGCNDAGPAVHPKSASASQFVHPPTQRPNGRDGERSRETDWERTMPHHGHAMTRTVAAAHRGYHRRRRAPTRAHAGPVLASLPACRRMADALCRAVLCCAVLCCNATWTQYVHGRQ